MIIILNSKMECIFYHACLHAVSHDLIMVHINIFSAHYSTLLFIILIAASADIKISDFSSSPTVAVESMPFTPLPSSISGIVHASVMYS